MKLGTLLLLSAIFAICPFSALAADGLGGAREGEFAFGPFDIDASHEGIRIPIKTWLFLSLIANERSLEIRARGLMDLRALQAQLGPLLHSLPLPKDRCAQKGLSLTPQNPVVKIYRERLSRRGDGAMISFDGKLDFWVCQGSLLTKSWLQGIEIEARFPFTIDAPDSSLSSLRVHALRPEIEPRNNFSAFVLEFLRVLGTDLKDEAHRLIRDAVKPLALKDLLSDELRELSPQLETSRFFDVHGNLALELELVVRLDREAMLKGELKAMP